jgi:hypothetical protein
MLALLTASDIEHLREAVADVAAMRRPEEVPARVVRHAAQLCGAPLAAMTMRAPGRDELGLVSVFGTGGRIVEGPLPVRGSLNGDVVTSGRSFRSVDVWRDAKASTGDIARRNRVRGLLIVPLPARGAVMGTIAVAKRARWQLSSRDEAMLAEFARNVRVPVGDISTRVAARCLNPSELTARTSWSHQPPRGTRRHVTAREHDILRLLLADHTCRQIASALGLSQRTVEHYLERLKLRFGKATLHGLATLVVAERLLEDPSLS